MPAARRAFFLLLAAICLLLGAAPRPRAEPLAGVRTFEIQGAAHVSPLVNRAVQDVSGVVTAVRSNGFTLQDPDGDDRPDTADAVLVFTRSAPNVAVGDSVRVSGTVREFRPGNDPANLSVTEVVLTTLTVDAPGQPLPAPVVLKTGGAGGPDGVGGVGGRIIPARVAGDGSDEDVEQSPALSPEAGTLDFFESLEAMRVQIDDAVAVGARAGPGELPVLPDDGAGVAGRTVRGGVLAARPGDALPRIMLTAGAARLPPAGVGDRFPGEIVGTVDYAFGGYRVRVDTLPALLPASYELSVVAPPDTLETLAVATFNVQNLSARERPAKLARLAETIMVGLGGPDLLVLQELQDDSGAGDDGTVSGTRSAQALADAITAAGGPGYTYREIAPANNEDGGAPGANIRVGFLYRQDRGLTFVERPGDNAATPVSIVPGAADAGSDDGSGDAADDGTRNGAGNMGGVRLSASPGRIVPDHPAWTASRKPLVGEFTFNGHRLLVVGCHFSSKLGDGPQSGRFQPPPRPSEARRIQQAHLVRAFAAEALTADSAARVIVLGDLNDVPGSATLAALTAPEQPGALTNLVDLLPAEERYSYVFGGQSEAIDHLLVSPSLRAATLLVAAVHSNAGTASSEGQGPPTDHDPLVAHFRLPAP